jgi:Polyketide cyclase / dehydrase and lipid transport
MKVALELTVNQPIALVFDQIADARNEAIWNSTLSDYALVGQGPIGKGSKFTYKNRGNEFSSELSEYNKPQSLAFQVHGKPMDIHATVKFKAISPTTTTIAAEYNLMPKGTMKLLLPLFGPFMHKAFAKEFENFKRFSESQK